MLVGVDIVAQWVRTTWTKRSRGGTEAARRNRAPIGFPLPESTGSLVHEVTIAERDGFEPRFEVRPIADLSGVTLREVDNVLTVQLTPALHGKPRRAWRPRPVRLIPGEWLRWQINYRFGAQCTCGDEWHYRLDTLNLAFGRPAGFTGRPTRTVDERGSLR